jgi:hypothetical protein
MPQLRRSYGKVSTNATGLLYLLCFRERLGTDKHSIKHYLGFTWDLDARLEKHRAGRGARITEVLKERGIGWDVAAVWPGNRGVENQLKLHSATRICPRCTPGAQTPRLVQAVIEAEARRRAREARKAARQIRDTQRHAAAIAKRAVMSPYERGADSAQRWKRQQAQAGRTAEQITATDAYITGPLRDSARANEAAKETSRGRGREAAVGFLLTWCDATADEIEQAAAALQTPYYEGTRTPEGDAENGAFAEVILTRLAWLRKKEAAAAQQPGPQAELDDNYAREAGADVYPEPGDWVSEPPVELEPGGGE